MLVALVDCDNFFASCERIMQPHLANVPVAVLSNNDGCIIARTNEVKAAGVGMGQPYHECKDTLERIGAEVVSANFLLYRSCAKRLQTVLRQIPAVSIEVYSIDESFIEFDEQTVGDVSVFMTDLHDLVLRWTGIAVTIGVGQSRALAKVAVHVGKKTGAHTYFLGAEQNSKTDTVLKTIALGDVWGVGRRLAPKLAVCGLRSAYDLAHMRADDPSLKVLTVTTKELIGELCGWPTAERRLASPRKSITHTRSFGEAIASHDDLRAALSSFTGEVAMKMHRHKLVAGRVSVFVRCREYGSGAQLVTVSSERKIAPTADLFALEQTVSEMLTDIFQTGAHYKKAGVLVSDLRPAAQYQLSLYDTVQDHEKSDSLMRAIDSIANEYHVAVLPATTLLGTQQWKGKRQYMSPYDHATWKTIPVVRA